jgi:hypothetical protein
MKCRRALHAPLPPLRLNGTLKSPYWPGPSTSGVGENVVSYSVSPVPSLTIVSERRSGPEFIPPSFIT